MKKRIVLLHGWGASINKLKPLKKELEKLDWEVLLPALPGFDGDPPKKVWGLSEYTEYVSEEVVRVWGQRNFVLFGHSFGGRVVVKYAVEKKNNVDAVVLCSIGGISRAGLVKRIFFWILAKLGRVLLISPSVARFWRKLLYKAAGEHDYEKTDGIKREIFKKVVNEDIKPYIGKITAPSLVVWGNEDKITPIKDAYFIKNNLPAASLQTFEKVGHRLPYQKHKKLAGIIDKWYSGIN